MKFLDIFRNFVLINQINQKNINEKQFQNLFLQKFTAKNIADTLKYQQFIIP